MVQVWHSGINVLNERQHEAILTLCCCGPVPPHDWPGMQMLIKIPNITCMGVLVIQSHSHGGAKLEAVWKWL
ncbi:hypothetical protein E2C01_096555 [Portunus trituberculatus]|uniref:Uncharacterized protein n=1 Tax=Portunus trituberculatus TaxID=210409 RepID=A0A5B7JY84_PORTR|nr:hypothetical protein [Portunus trituberculatus]